MINFRTVAINIGRPILDFRINEDLAIGVGAFSSLFFSYHPTLVVDSGRIVFEVDCFKKLVKLIGDF